MRRNGGCMLRALFIFILGIFLNHSISADTRLYMFLGCERHTDDSGALHTYLKVALKIINNRLSDLSSHDALLVSQSVLQAIKVVCQRDCQEYRPLTLFDIYEIDGVGRQKYYLFIPSKSKYYFQQIFNIEILRKIIFGQISTLSTPCRDSDSSDYKYLVNKIFKKNFTIDPISIYMSGHGQLGCEVDIDTLEQSSFQDPALKPFQRKIIDLFKDPYNRSVFHRLSQLDDMQELQLRLKIIFRINISFDKIPSLQKFIGQLWRLNNCKENSLIANMDIGSFAYVLNFFDKNIPVKSVFIETCHGGGLNSIVPYVDMEALNRPYLQKTYSFDIINVSSQEGVVWSTADFLNFMDIIAKPGLLSKNLDQFIASSSFRFLYKYYAPMIRPKNQRNWFSLFKNYTSSQFAGFDFKMFDITAMLAAIYERENKSFIFSSSRNSIFVTTKCIGAPIVFTRPPDATLKQFVIREKELLINSLVINCDDLNLFDDQHNPNNIALFISRLISLFVQKDLISNKSTLGKFIAIKHLRFFNKQRKEVVYEDVSLFDDSNAITCSFKKRNEASYMKLSFDNDYFSKISVDERFKISFFPSTVTIKAGGNKDQRISQLEQDCKKRSLPLKSLENQLQGRKELVEILDKKKDITPEQLILQRQKALASRRARVKDAILVCLGIQRAPEHAELPEENQRDRSFDHESERSRSLRDKILTCLTGR